MENTVEKQEELNNQQVDETSKTSEKRNRIGNALYVAGWFYIFATVVGAITMKTQYYFEIQFVFLEFVFGILGGLILLGFSEIINLLHDIKNK